MRVARAHIDTAFMSKHRTIQNKVHELARRYLIHLEKNQGSNSLGLLDLSGQRFASACVILCGIFNNISVWKHISIQVL